VDNQITHEKQAVELFSRTWFDIEQQLYVVQRFLQLGEWGLPLAAEKSLRQHTDLFGKLMHDPDYAKYVNQQELAESSLSVNLPSQIAGKEVNQFRYSLAAGSVVFVHSIVDDAVLKFCKVCATQSPNDFLHLISRRKIEISSLVNEGADAVIQSSVQEYLEALERKSLLEKTDVLFQICKPAKDFAPMADFKFDRDALKEFDELRHSIVHRVAIGEPVQFGDEKIYWCFRMLAYNMAMVSEKYSLKLDVNYVVRAQQP
jgi:predicted HTH domain antitoxin